jgi:hypothetical protein
VNGYGKRAASPAPTPSAKELDAELEDRQVGVMVWLLRGSPGGSQVTRPFPFPFPFPAPHTNPEVKVEGVLVQSRTYRCGGSHSSLAPPPVPLRPSTH